MSFYKSTFLRTVIPAITVMAICCACRSDAVDNQDLVLDLVPDVKQQFCPLPDESVISLPKDDGLHDEPIEWWYWTGLLSDEFGRQYGFQFTIFVFAMGPAHAILSNVAISDLDGGTFHHAAKFDFAEPVSVEQGFFFESGEQSVQGSNGLDYIHASLDGLGLDLELTDPVGPLLQHENGYQEYPFGGYTYYYSRPSMTASGELRLPEGVLQVSGSAWFDHQWGDLQMATDYGWDWFAINLDDGREIMLFIVRAPEGDALVGGTMRTTDCQVREISSNDLSLEALDEWQSPETGCIYPSGWDIAIDDINLTVTPALKTQEMANQHDPSKTYWEGAAHVSGDATGRAYVELTGYCSDQ